MISTWKLVNINSFVLYSDDLFEIIHMYTTFFACWSFRKNVSLQNKFFNKLFITKILFLVY